MGLDVLGSNCHSLSMNFLIKSFVFSVMLLSSANIGTADTVPVPTPKPEPAKTEGAEEKTPEKPKDERIYQSACPAVLNGFVKAKHLPPLFEGQCGERSPLDVAEIAGVMLTAKAVLNCRMATTLVGWMKGANQTSQDLLGSSIKKLNASTTYQCRRRNNAPDGKISEHGFANALDIVGFTLEDGRNISLLENWPLPKEPAEGEEEKSSPVEMTPEFEFLKTVRDQACESFTTVLGPESNPLHADHFHFDLGCHGKTCRYKICE